MERLTGFRRKFRLIAAAALGWAVASSAAGACGLGLVLAHDVSSSVSRLEYALQRLGHAEAFRDPEIQQEILAMGEMQAILVHWSAPEYQSRITPWRVLRTRADIDAFADELASARRRFEVGSTAIGELLGWVETFWDAPPASACARRVIDVSGDGVSNSGQPLAAARERLLAKGVTINGLVIVNEELVEAHPLPHYRNEVIGGPGSFAMRANGFEDYGRAFRKKLLRELKGPPLALAPGDGAAPRRAPALALEGAPAPLRRLTPPERR